MGGLIQNQSSLALMEWNIFISPFTRPQNEIKLILNLWACLSNRHPFYIFVISFSCLATNNLLALLGMLTTSVLKYNLSEEVLQSFIRLDCVGHVVWRFFGLSSGCIAAVMAAERWMALARPFIYHKVSKAKGY